MYVLVQIACPEFSLRLYNQLLGSFLYTVYIHTNTNTHTHASMRTPDGNSYMLKNL